MILGTLRDLARTLGCRPDQADDVVRSEPSARAALSRRGLFKAAGAVAAGVAFGDVATETLQPWQVLYLEAKKREFDLAYEKLGRQFAQTIWGVSGFEPKIRVWPVSILPPR